MKRVLIMLLCIVMLFSVTSFASADAPTTATLPSGTEINLSGMPIVNEPMEFELMAYVPTGAESYDKLLFTSEMEARSNVHIKWTEVSPLAVNEKVNLALASDELPDAFFKCSISNQIQERYIDDGVFVALNDYLETYMPAFNATLEKYSDLGPSIALSNGLIYGVPYTNGVPSMGGGPVGWYNKKFYDKLGISEPKTLDEFFDAMVAVRDGDPNGNGEADEIPILAGIGSLTGYITSAYQLQNRGTSTGYIDAQPDDTSKIRFWPTDTRYREALDFVRKLWENNLIDTEDFIKSDLPSMMAKYNEDRVGFTLQLYTQIDKAGPDFAHITQPLETPYGQGLSQKGATNFGSGNFIITKMCKDPEVLCRWVDYFYTDEGMELFFMGVKDKTFIVKEDGTLCYTDEILHNPDGLSYVQAFGKYLCWGDGRNPALLDAKYFQGGAELTPQEISRAKALEPYLPDEIWPDFNATEEESKFFATNGVDIETLVGELRANWVTGNVENSDAVWEDYINQLNNMGLEQYIAYKQAQYDRYAHR